MSEYGKTKTTEEKKERKNGMKTNLKKWVATLVILIVGILGFNIDLIAQQPPPTSGGGSSAGDPYPADLAFLGSEGALRPWAVEMGRGCRVGVGMNSTTESQSSWTGGWDRSMNSVEMFRFVDGLFDNLWIKTVNPSDWVWAYGTITSAEGEDLIYGGGGTYPVVGKGGSVELPTFKMQYQLASTIGVPFEGIESAEMLVTDEQSRGQTTGRFNLEVRNGKFYFRTDMAGKGFLVLRTKGGSTVVYDLVYGGTRTMAEKISFVGKVTSTIDHLIPIVNPTEAYTYVERSWDGVGVNPTFEVIINVEQKLGVIDLRVSSTEGFKPIAFKVRAQGNPLWKKLPVSNGRLYIQGPFERAVYYIVPEWNSDEFRSREPYIYKGDGGKG